MAEPTAARLGAALLHRLDGTRDCRVLPAGLPAAVYNKAVRPTGAKRGLEPAGAALGLTGARLAI